MNNKARIVMKNLSYTLFSNLVSLCISILLVLIIPKLIGIEEYGYWQLYLFYSSFVGFMQFGWNDGVYLRYGGQKYKDLDKKLFFSQFWMLTISQIILAGIVILLSFIFIYEVERQFILNMVALCIIILGIRAMLLFILQSTNRIKEYAKVTMLDRVLYCFIIIIFLVFGIREYKLMIISDLIAKFISLLYAMYFCHDMVFRKFSTFYLSLKETLDNINAGIKLMFANIASVLIIGVVRFGIEHAWDVTTFGKISLTLSISNLMMLFINAVGIIMFPILRRSDEKDYPNIYITMRDFLMVVLLGALLVYYPLKIVLTLWLPSYSDSLIYMALVFPMCVYEGKMALLINTYLKAMRKEKLMLKINLVSLSMSVIITLINICILKNLNLTISSIVILLALRCIMAEVLLSKILSISLNKDIVLELLITLIFILSGWFFNTGVAVLIYTLSYIIYLAIKRNDIIKTLKNIKLLMRA